MPTPHPIPFDPTPDTPALNTATYTEWMEDALQQPTLTEAFVRLAIRETDRVIRAKRSSSPFETYDTCYQYMFTQLRDAWIAARKPLTDFQPNFCPPPPPR